MARVFTKTISTDEVAASPAKAIAPLPSFDVERLRRDFPALNVRHRGKPIIYLDNAATSHKPQAVLDAPPPTSR